jgi:sulfur carrier protein ThiS
VEIKAKISRTKETRKINVKTGSTVEHILKKIELKPDTLIVMSNNKPIPIDDVLNDDQELTIIQVASGG